MANFEAAMATNVAITSSGATQKFKAVFIIDILPKHAFKMLSMLRGHASLSFLALPSRPLSPLVVRAILSLIVLDMTPSKSTDFAMRIAYALMLNVSDNQLSILQGIISPAPFDISPCRGSAAWHEMGASFIYGPKPILYSQ